MGPGKFVKNGGDGDGIRKSWQQLEKYRQKRNPTVHLIEMICWCELAKVDIVEGQSFMKSSASLCLTPLSHSWTSQEQTAQRCEHILGSIQFWQWREHRGGHGGVDRENKRLEGYEYQWRTGRLYISFFFLFQSSPSRQKKKWWTTPQLRRADASTTKAWSVLSSWQRDLIVRRKTGMGFSFFLFIEVNRHIGPQYINNQVVYGPNVLTDWRHWYEKKRVQWPGPHGLWSIMAQIEFLLIHRLL